MILLFTAALCLRIIFAYTYGGFESDTACFFSWANMLKTNGFADFYSPDYFCDYPPGYLYILYLLGDCMQFFGIESLNNSGLLILKAPAILCDIAAGYLIWYHAQKHCSPKASLLLSACYLFHPAVLINSSLWGQVDAVFTLIILLACILLTQGRYIPAYFLYAMGILLKPQVLIFAPLILCALAEYISHTKSIKKILAHIGSGITAIIMLILLCLPFGLQNVIAQYTDTLSSYPYAAVNACNAWGLFGQNWISQDTKLGFFTYAQIGTWSILLTTFLAFLIFYTLRKRSDRYYLTGAFLVLSVFLFSVRMHERYLFPVMLLLMFTFIHNKEKAYLFHFWTISICHFFNVYYVLYCYDPTNYDRHSFPLLSVSFLTILSGILFYYTLLHSAKDIPATLPFVSALPKVMPWTMSHGRKFINAPVSPKASDRSLGLNKWDMIAMIAISLFYGIFAFINLGITKTPVTECAFPYNTYLELDTVSDCEITNIYWYLLNEQDIDCRLEIKQTPAANWEYVQDIELKNVFKWDTFTLPAPAVSVRLTNLTKDTHIGELVFTDDSGNPLKIAQEETYYTLFDEADTFPGTLSAQTGTYFDEIYYTRTVYEFMHGLPSYENTHPPFGKLLITLGVILFGTTPFGFRFMGALFGVLMLPFMYLLGRNVTKSRAVGFFCAFLFAFDFMHFAQTRLATIDVFITFFVIVMYYFMERYSRLSFYDTSLKKTWLPLGACGIAFGFGIASKWTGAYAGVGLAIIFFLQLFTRYKEYKYALSAPQGETNKIKHTHIIAHFKEYSLKTIGFCMVFFVAIPFVIYLLSYIPFVDLSHPGLLERMAANQVNMFNYHSNLDATHPYSSLWYEWPTIIRPIFYYSRQLEGNLRLGISAFGNPLIWWAGIPAFLCTIYLAVAHRKKTALFVLIGYLAQFLPWVLVDRCTFIYHYFPSVPFVVLMLSYTFIQFKKHLTARSFYILLAAYAMLVFVLFLLFYPVLAGTPVSTDYVDTYLRWLGSWVLVLN